MSKIIGIYKISSPSGKIYIGQSLDINYRFTRYKRYYTSGQKKLFASLKKYGADNHIFEIIEECKIDIILIRERYWQDFYDVLNPKKGLNLKLTSTEDKKLIHSEETRKKISKGLSGRTLSEEHKKKISNSSKGKIHSEEAKNNMSKAKKGKKMSKQVKENMSKGIKKGWEKRKQTKLIESLKQDNKCWDCNGEIKDGVCFCNETFKEESSNWDEFFKEINNDYFVGWSEEAISGYITCRGTVIEKSKNYLPPVKR